MTEETAKGSCDVLVIGGALAGASVATLLLRAQPGLRVQIIEKSATFTRRVGEATVEISGYFLGRILGLTRHLNDRHLVKQGMRFWFCNGRARTLAECSEIGARYLVRIPAYQVDRAVLDEEVLQRAVALGAGLMRSARVLEVKLASGARQTVTVQQDGRTLEISARWVVDASGVAAVLARREGWFRPNAAHPTTAVWARWQGVKDWDGVELAARYPEWARQCHGIRGTATNHLMGDGWWAWWIPLKGGDVSIGVVFDQRRVDWPAGGVLGRRLQDFLVAQHPAARELLGEAHWVEGDVHWRKDLPYSSTTCAGDGFVLVGDAAGFIDPLYSPGMDWLSFTAARASRLILAQVRGEAMAPLVAKHNRDFAVSYDRWFRALYQDKYDYLGDYELMRIAFLMDLGLYYLGVVRQPFERGLAGFEDPVFAPPLALPFYRFIRFYNGRLASLGRARRARGTHGRRNDGHRFLFGGYTLHRASARHVAKGFALWCWLELTEGWRTWLTPNARAGSSAAASETVRPPTA